MTSNVTLTFLGAAGTVTGSKLLIERDSTRVLVDAGLFQGVRALRRRNWEPLAVPADSLDAVVISHAHLDHCGYLPALVRQGFNGPIYATRETVELAEIVLRDSAKLQQDDANYAAQHAYSRHARPAPLYSEKDVVAALPMFHDLGFDTPHEIAPDVRLTLRPAGHILGSSAPHVSVAGGIQFSGDLGRPDHPLLLPPAPPAPAAAIVVESTYGNRHHQTDAREDLAAAIRRTIQRGGSVVIPAFAVDRTEVILMTIRDLSRAGRIPQVPVYVDSPMALRALAVYRSAIATQASDVRSDMSRHPFDTGDPFDTGNLKEAHTSEESIRLNDPAQPCIIISASGMATGGRILHHLKRMLPRQRNTVILVGFQAAGTRGRDLAEGVGQVKIHGTYVPVKAEIVDLAGFSVHADADELMAWLASAPEPPQIVYVVHGEPDAAAALAERVRTDLGWMAVVARDGEKVRVP